MRGNPQLDNFEGRPGPFAVSRQFTQIRPKRLRSNGTVNKWQPRKYNNYVSKSNWIFLQNSNESTN